MISGVSDHTLVSVVIPCHNQAHFLGEAVESIASQTYPRIETIVVDDGSTDDIAHIMNAYPHVHVVRQQNLGVSRARNVGLSHSHGHYLLFLDADDRLLPDAVTIGVQELAARKDCAFVFGLYRSIGVYQGLRELPVDLNYSYRDMLARNFVGNPGVVLYQRWAFEAVGGFDEQNGPAADYDLYLRIARRFPIYCHHKPVIEYRRHDDNMSNNAKIMLQSTMTVLKAQRQHVKGHADLEAAYETGKRFWKDYYGEPLLVQIHEDFSRGRFLRAIGDTYSLVRYFPERFWIFARRKLAKLFPS